MNKKPEWRKSVGKYLSNRMSHHGKSNKLYTFKTISLDCLIEFATDLESQVLAPSTTLYVCMEDVASIRMGDTLELLKRRKDGSLKLVDSGNTTIDLNADQACCMDKKSRCHWTLEDIIRYEVIPNTTEDTFYVDKMMSEPFKGVFVCPPPNMELISLIDFLEERKISNVWLHAFCFNHHLSKHTELIDSKMFKGMKKFDERLIHSHSWLTDVTRRLDKKKNDVYALKTSLELKVVIFGERHPMVNQAMVNLAQVYEQEGNMDQALKFHKYSMGEEKRFSLYTKLIK